MTETTKMPHVYRANKVLFFGDMHFDDNFNGKHKDYEANTYEVMQQIMKIYDQEKPDWVVLAGDLIGVSRGRSKITSRQYLKSVIQFLTYIGGGESKHHLIVVKGNHDFNIESDYNFLDGIHEFYSPVALDGVLAIKPVNHDEPDNQVFIHLRDYNDEQTPVFNPDDDKDYHDAKVAGVNMVVAHNDFYVEGQSEGYHDKDTAFNLTDFTPFYGSDIVLTGHIHVPSTHTTGYTTGDGTEAAFLNLGCPTRPSSSEAYNKVWYASLDFSEPDPRTNDKAEWDYNPIPMTLKDFRDEFNDSDDLIKGMDKMIDKKDKVHREKLTQILGMLEDDSLLSNDVIAQVDLITIARPQSRELAKKYIKQAQQEF